MWKMIHVKEFKVSKFSNSKKTNIKAVARMLMWEHTSKQGPERSALLRISVRSDIPCFLVLPFILMQTKYIKNTNAIQEHFHCIPKIKVNIPVQQYPLASFHYIGKWRLEKLIQIIRYEKRIISEIGHRLLKTMSISGIYKDFTTASTPCRAKVFIFFARIWNSHALTFCDP